MNSSGKALEDDIPVNVEHRLRAGIADFQSRLGAGTVSLVSRSKSQQRLVAWCIGISAAVILLGVFWNWFLQPPKIFAEVAAAVCPAAVDPCGEHRLCGQ